MCLLEFPGGERCSICDRRRPRAGEISDILRPLGDVECSTVGDVDVGALGAVRKGVERAAEVDGSGGVDCDRGAGADGHTDWRRCCCRRRYRLWPE